MNEITNIVSRFGLAVAAIVLLLVILGSVLLAYFGRAPRSTRTIAEHRDRTPETYGPLHLYLTHHNGVMPRDPDTREAIMLAQTAYEERVPDVDDDRPAPT